MESYKKKIVFSERYIFLYIIVFLVAIVLISTLFYLQIIKGEEYRTQSNNRLLRENVVQAPRGDILDRNNNVLVSNKMGFSLMLYKINISTEKLNESLLKITNILIKNGDKYVNTLPIGFDENGNVIFTNSEENQVIWKENYKYNSEDTAYDVLLKLKEKYKIQNEDLQEVRIIAGQRFDIEKTGYGAFYPYQISSNISRQTINEIEEQNDNFPGINISTIPLRMYTMGSFAAHILGYTGSVSIDDLKNNSIYSRNDIIGRSGIEYVFEKYLKGTNGIKKVEMDFNGKINEEYEVDPSIKGNDVILTIDGNLQKVAEEKLKDNIEKISSGGFKYKYEDANAGSVIVMDVNTGEILAMASYPTYDPSLFIGGISTKEWNTLINNGAKPLYDRTIQASYAPGSTFKMVSAIAALESNSIGIYDEIEDLGIYDKGHRPQCWYYTSYGLTHKLVNVSKAIKTSCNYYFYEVGYRMGIDTISRYASYFGLGTKTGIELPGEISGILASREYANSKGNEWYVADTLSAVIGQSYNSFTPIQIATYISILSNGGYKIKPTIIKDVVTPDGLSYNKEEIKADINNLLGIEAKNVEQLVFSQENVNAVLQGMRDVTDETGGTAYGVFKSLSVTVGGKTGTAEASSGSNNGIFVGFAPYEKPEIAVVVIVEHGGHGSYAAEVVRDIMKEYFGERSDNLVDDKTIDTLSPALD
ncbi:MAG: penicillin-binding protein 2 [Clostridia bacterium]|nr:penicillin-binding protein 2 [Clostridia bacterium]